MNSLLKISILLVLALFSANTSFSQSLVWEKAAGTFTREDYCYTSSQLGKNRYIFGGYEWHPTQNLKIPLLIFTNPNGDTILSKRYPQFYEGVILSVSTEKDSSIISVGFHQVNNQGKSFIFKSDYNGNIIWQREIYNNYLGSRATVKILPDGYLVYGGIGILFKLDRQGTVQWQKTPLVNSAGGGLSVMKDGSYLTTGWTPSKSPASVPNYHRTNPFLAKLKPNGDTIRTKIFGSFTDKDLLYEAKETADGGIIMVGYYVLNSNPTKRQGLVMKFDSLWNQQWWYTIMPPLGTSDYGCELYNVYQLADSSYIVSGSFLSTNPSLPNGDHNGYVAKLAKNGSAIIWQQNYGPNNSAEVFNSMFYLSDGSVVFSGTKYVNPILDFYLVKLKNLGLPYIPNYCQQKPLPGLSVQVITNDTIVFTSNSFPGTRYGSISTYTWRFGDGTTSTKANPKHKYNMPLSALQNMPVTLIVTNNSGCTDSITTYPFLRVSAPDALPGLQVQLYPNPASSKATFTISSFKGKEFVRIEIVDVLGRKVMVPVIQQETGDMQQLEVNTSALPVGLYLYRLYSSSQLLGSGKLVKE